MLVITAVIAVFSILSAYVVGQITIGAKCLSGYEWVRHFYMNVLPSD